MRPAMALIPNKEDVWKAPNIHIASLLCIFLSSLRGYNNGTLL